MSIVIVKSGPLERNWLMGDFGGVSIEHYPGPGLYSLYKHSTCRLNSFFSIFFKLLIAILYSAETWMDIAIQR